MSQSESKDVILIGAGVLSTTFGSFLKEIQPNWNIKLFERLDGPALESSYDTSNAGTGHAALCELNYTVEQPDGSIDVEKAKEINEEFEISKQFWAHLVKTNAISNPREFITPLPHISFVQGIRNVQFLQKRYDALKDLPMFKGIEFTQDREKLAEWMPLMMKDRKENIAIAASKIDEGTDVNFGELTRKLAKNLESHDNAELNYNHEVIGFQQLGDKKWEVEVRNLDDNTISTHVADYIFIGAGGAAIPLLQKTKIEESKNLGGFPISGAFLVCKNPEVVKEHDAKAYGKEPPGTPPMTVPHLDRRYVRGEESLLFGPFAAIGPKFLKHGSNLDLFRSLNKDNILTMTSAGMKNLSLVKYSIQQLMMKKEDRMKELRRFVPSAKDEDWELHIAGKRVQVIKDTPEFGKGFIQFGTEVVHSKDHTVVAMLGESPGASTSVSVALDIIEQNFPDYVEAWTPKIQEMIPSYGQSLIEDTTLLNKVREDSAKALELNEK